MHTLAHAHAHAWRKLVVVNRVGSMGSMICVRDDSHGLFSSGSPDRSTSTDGDLHLKNSTLVVLHARAPTK